MEIKNPNPALGRELNTYRGVNKDYQVNQDLFCNNLLTVAYNVIKKITTENLVKALTSSSPQQVIILIVEKLGINWHESACNDERMNRELSNCLDDLSEGVPFPILVSRLEQAVGDIIIQDIFYIREIWKEGNYDIFQTDAELPF